MARMYGGDGGGGGSGDASIMQLISALTGQDKTGGGFKMIAGPDGKPQVQFEPVTAGGGFLASGARRKAQDLNTAIMSEMFGAQEKSKADIKRIQEEGSQSRITQAEEARLKKEIASHASEIAKKQAILQGGVQGMVGHGGIPTSEQDINVFGQALNDPIARNELMKVMQENQTLGSPAGMDANRLGMLSKLLAPLYANRRNLTENIAPDNLLTEPRLNTGTGQFDLTGSPNRQQGMALDEQLIQSTKDIKDEKGNVIGTFPGDSKMRRTYKLPPDMSIIDQAKRMGAGQQDASGQVNSSVDVNPNPTPSQDDIAKYIQNLMMMKSGSTNQFKRNSYFNY